jgi:hypothetical protein
VLLQKQLQPFFFFASICSEWLASVYVSEQLHSDCIMFVAWKAWFPCCQGHVTVKLYSAQSLKKEKRSIGHCCFLYVLLLLGDFTCEIELLQYMLLVISQFNWAFAFLGVMIVILKFALLDIILLVLKIFNVKYCSWNFAATTF